MFLLKALPIFMDTIIPAWFTILISAPLVTVFAEVMFVSINEVNYIYYIINQIFIEFCLYHTCYFRFYLKLYAQDMDLLLEQNWLLLLICFC